jgi:hypothetical protein
MVDISRIGRGEGDREGRGGEGDREGRGGEGEGGEGGHMTGLFCFLGHLPV